MTGHPAFRFRRLVWLMPAAFAVHIVEELAGGFPDWVGAVAGSPMPVPDFLLNNAGFMAVLLALTAWTSLRPGRLPAFLLLAWASGNLFWNSVFHLVTTVWLGRYSPGLVTAVLLYLPLSFAVVRAALREAVLTPAGLAAAAGIGAGLMLLVIWGRLLGVTA